MTIDPAMINKVKTALDNTYEKKVNKKSSIGSDPGSTDYPTSQAVKDFIENKGYLTSHQDITGKEDKSNLVTSWSATTSNTRYPSEKLVKDSLDNKVDESSITNVVRTSSEIGLIKNDGSIDKNTYLTSSDISGKEDKDNKVTSWSSTPNNTKYPSEKLVYDSLALKTTDSTLHTVAKTGDYDDLENLPTIPTQTSQLENNSGFLTSHQSLADYVKTTDSRLSDSRTPKSHTHGNISNDGKIGSASGKIITTGTNGVLQASSTITKSMISDFPTSLTPTAHNQASSTITDTNTYSNIDNANTTQESINSAIDEKLGALANIEYFEVVGSLGTASASTMNKLYLIKSDSDKDDNYETYITVQNGNTYSWEMIDSTSLDLSGYALKSSLATVATSGSYTNLTNKPSFTQDSSITASTPGRYAIGTININGSSVTIYGVDTGTSMENIDSEINAALEELAIAIDPTIAS